MTPQSSQTRREFLKTSSHAVAGAAIVGALATPRPGYTAESNTIKVALVGCGGRGTGAAANALATSQQGPIQLWAMADVFDHRLEGSVKALNGQFTSQMFVPPERRFVGLDGFKKAIDSLGKGDVVILATPAGFRPIHFQYAVEKGVNVFMEKSFGADAPSIRRILKSGEAAAQKNLKVATGLMWRHDKPREEVIKRIHDGAIGDLILLRTYRMHGPVGFTAKKPGTSEFAHQIANFANFTYLSSSFYVDWLIHNIDVCCWAKNALPVTAQGHGGRSARTEPDEMFDHYAIEYTFDDGTMLLAQGRHIFNCHDVFSDFAQGSKGSALIMESLAAPRPRIYKNHKQTRENEVWRYSGSPCDPYQVEWDLLVDAIRHDKPYNEVERSAKACLVAIMGRMAAESGKLITFDEAMASNLELAPGLEKIASLDAPPPLQPDANGRYAIAVPGRTKVL